jgi:chain length determinant protein EpsF
MNLYLFLSALRARFGTFLSVLLITVVSALVVSLLLPKVYTATTSLVVDFKNEQSFNDPRNPLLIAPRDNVGYMQTQMDIITSEKVARKVVKQLKLAEDPEVRADFEENYTGTGTIEDWLVEDLLEWLTVNTSQSSIIQITFASGGAEFAARVANAFAAGYLETLLELRVEPTRDAAAWFDEQLRTLRIHLQQAQARLTEYQRRNGIVSPEENQDTDNTRLTELSMQLARAQDQTFDLESRAQQARGFLQQRATLDELPEVLNNAYVQRLKADLQAAESRLQQLATQFGPNYPTYQNQLSEVRGLRERLNAEMRKIVAGMEAAARQSRQREEDLRAAMSGQKTQLLDRKGNRNELIVLLRDVSSAQAAYDTAMQRYVSNQVDSRANQTNVSILNQAVPPSKPARPKVLLNVALSIVVGTMLGLGLILLLEMFDRRVRSRTDLDIVQSNVPLLAVLNAWAPAKHPMLVRADGTRRALPRPH